MPRDRSEAVVWGSHRRKGGRLDAGAIIPDSTGWTPRGRAARHRRPGIDARPQAPPLSLSRRSHASTYSWIRRLTTSAERSTRFIMPTIWPTGLKLTSLAASG